MLFHHQYEHCLIQRLKTTLNLKGCFIMKTRFGIIGLGRIAKSFANAVALTDNSEIVAGASRSLENAQQFCSEFNIKNAYGSYEELVQSDEVDAVYISTIHTTHFEVAKLCLNHGKAVICEKPFVLSTEQCLELANLAKEKNLLIMEAMWTRFLPTVNKAHEWISAGKIGDIKAIDVAFGFAAIPTPDENNRIFSKKLAGGAMYDLGVYTIEFALDFAKSELKDICVLSHFGETDVDEVNVMSLKFKNEVLASLKTSVTSSFLPDAYVFGTTGFIHFEKFFGGNKCTLYDKSYKSVEIFETDNIETFEGFKFEVEHFSQLFLDGKKESPRMPITHNLECLKVFEKMMENK